MERIRTALLMHMPSSYHLPLLRRVATHPSLDLTTYFCTWEDPDRGWNFEHPQEWKCVVLPRFLRASLKKKGSDLNPVIVYELRKNQYDVVVIAGYWPLTMLLAVTWCIISGTPYIIWSESHHFKPRSWVTRFTKRMMLPVIVRRSPACFAAGSYAKDYLVSYGANPARIFIVRNTPDVEFYAKESHRYLSQKEELKKRLGIRSEIVILFVGRLLALKGLRFLLSAYSKLRKEHESIGLLIVGDGPLRGELEAQCAKGQIRDVYFVGFRQPKELPLYYALGDIFVLPSLQESWGAVVNEAMACGLPIVATRVTGAAGDIVVDGENGFVIAEGNVEELYQALKILVEDPEKRVRMGAISRKIIAGWTYERDVQNFVAGVSLAAKR